MPQMSPMWWTTIFMMFLSVFAMSMINIYFFKNQKKKMNSIFQENSPKSKKTDWVW